MVAKCANPACASEFHYLGDGRVFVGEVPGTESSRTRQYAWLCGKCLGQMTLVFEKDTGEPRLMNMDAA